MKLDNMRLQRMGRSRTTRALEDIQLGERRQSQIRAVSEQEMIEFAGQFDPLFFHCDPIAAERSMFGGLVASGIHSIALWRRLDTEVNGDIDVICGVSLNKVLFKSPLRPGDAVQLFSEVLELKPSASRPERGSVLTRHELRNQRDEVVLSLEAVGLVHTRRGRASP